MRNLATAAAAALGAQSKVLVTPVAAFTDAEIAAKLISNDDVRACVDTLSKTHLYASSQRKFGGTSTASASIANGVLTLAGELAAYDGVSFGMTVLPCPADLSDTDGLQLRIKGDGQTYKLLVKTVRAWHVSMQVHDGSQDDETEEHFQALLETTTEWQTVRVPWRAFVRARKGMAVEVRSSWACEGNIRAHRRGRRSTWPPFEAWA